MHRTFLLLFLFVGIHFCHAQDTTVLVQPGMFDKDSMQIFIGNKKGWLFKLGNDTSWAGKEIDLTGWEKRMPTELSETLADKNGKLEGWFRLKIKLDSTFGDMPLWFRISSWAASDFYVDGQWIASFGNTGLNGAPYQENRFVANLLPTPFTLKPGIEYTLALHVVDYISPFPPYELKAKESSLAGLIRITGPNYYKFVVENVTSGVYYTMLFTVISTVLSLLFWLLFLQNRTEKNLLIFALASTFLTISLIGTTLTNYRGSSYGGISYAWLWIYKQAGSYSLLAFLVILPFVLARIFKRRVSLVLKIIAVLCLLFGMNEVAEIYDLGRNLTFAVFIALFTPIFIACCYYVVSSWKTLKGAQWSIVAGLMLMFGLFLFLLIAQAIFPGFTNQIAELVLAAIVLSFPMSLMVYVAMRFKEIIKEVQEHASQVVQMSEEKKEQALNQQKILQEEVTRQTAEIRTTLDNLKATQSQLIQAEKMASLGELTAGIAHEIQNPLNFVNNFSEVNKDLLEEVKSQKSKVKNEELDDLLNDIYQNNEKIHHHGKRADAIVKGMLQHSRSNSGVKEPTDINALTDEYLRLAYHGLKAKDKSFNATIKTEFDQSIGNINIIPQDIGRVLLNLINNAFYAVNEKKKQIGSGYEPEVTVSTKLSGAKSSLNHQSGTISAKLIRNPESGIIHTASSLMISVRDNGKGIPDSIKEKIFQPFFTTKPTGQGTGLGLSLSYDIMKAHGGSLEVESKVGIGTEFKIFLPNT